MIGGISGGAAFLLIAGVILFLLCYCIKVPDGKNKGGRVKLWQWAFFCCNKSTPSVKELQPAATPGKANPAQGSQSRSSEDIPRSTEPVEKDAKQQQHPQKVLLYGAGLNQGGDETGPPQKILRRDEWVNVLYR